MQTEMIKILTIGEQIGRVFTTLYGWILLGLTSVVSLIESERLAFGIVFLTVVLDLFWGVIVAIKQKRFVLSEAARETVKKALIYASTLFVVLLIEKTIHEDYFIGFRVVCSVAAACELISISANMLIVKPDMPFVKIFAMQLKGEMRKKMNINTGKIFDENNEEKEEV